MKACQLALKLAVAGCLAFVAPVPAAAQPAGVPVLANLERHQVTDRLGRQVTYYLSRPPRPAPLLLMIQGSGCDRIIHGSGTGTYSTLYNLLPYAAAGDFAVLAVEKPNGGRESGEAGGSARGCSAAFNREFTAESWLAALQASVEAARRRPWVDRSRMLVIGVSEGAVMGSLLAASDLRVTDIVAIGGSGTTQLYDIVERAYRRCFDRSACLAEIEEQARAIAAAPESDTEFAWGHPYRRWSSFFRIDPGEQLLRSRARVYLAFGTKDEAVPPLSQEVAAARLLGAGRDVTVRRVPDAGHNLATPGAADFSGVDSEYRRALEWFWAGPARRREIGAPPPRSSDRRRR